MSRPAGTCKLCGRSILWATDPLGKAIPLDPTPPTYTTAPSADGGGLTARRADGVFVSHFATCPGVEGNRRATGNERDQACFDFSAAASATAG